MRTRSRFGLSRRQFLQSVGGAALAASFFPKLRVMSKPTRQLSGDLRILQWSHFVPQYDVWFDPFVQAWGAANGVNVTVDHVNLAEIPATTAAELQAGEGHDLIEWLSPPAAIEQSVMDMGELVAIAQERFGPQTSLAQRATFNPTTGKYYGFCHGWVPDPGNYRRSQWEQIGMPDGPTTWMDVLEGGTRIRNEQGVQMGIGMSNELDSNMAAHALIWSFGGSVQDEAENVTINSPQVIEAVTFMKQLYEQAMTPEVFGWTAASNNQLLIAGQASFILNSISAYRTAQEVEPDIANDVFFTPPIQGPGGIGLASEHVIPIYIIPNHSRNPEAAQELILHLLANYHEAVYNSKLYTFPAFFDTTPDLMAGEDWLGNDPFASEPPDKLSFLREAESWSTVVGHPGPANAATGELFDTFVLPQMFAKAARGELSPEDAVAEAEAQITVIYDKWRAEGLIGGAEGATSTEEAAATEEA